MKVIHKYLKNIIIIILAFLIVFYYVLPSSLAILLSCAVILISIKRIKSFVPVIWYGVFFIYVLLVSLLRDTSMIYVSSCANVLLILISVSLVVQGISERAIFLKATSIFGGVLCIFLYTRYYMYIGVGRFGEELPGTNIQSSILLGYILLYISSIQIWSFFHSKTWWYKLLYLSLFVFSLWLTFFTGTRKALLLPILFCLFILIINYKKNKFKLIIILSIVGILLCFAGNYLANSDYMSTEQMERWVGILGFFNDDIAKDASSEERTYLLKQGLYLFSQNPLFGYGIDATLKELSKHPHNNYVSLLSYGGIILFLLYYWIYIYVLLGFQKKLRSDYSLYILGTIVILLSDMGTTSFNIMYFSVCISLLFVPTSSCANQHNLIR